MVRYSKPRNAKLTVLVPKSVLEDLKALRMATFQSTGDLVNQLLESELERQQDMVNEGYEYLKIQESRKAKAEQRKGSAAAKPREGLQRTEDRPRVAQEGSAAAKPREGLPSFDDAVLWASLSDNKEETARRKKDVVAFLEWLNDTSRSMNEESIEDYYQTVLLSNGRSEPTAKRHKGRIRNF